MRYEFHWLRFSQRTETNRVRVGLSVEARATAQELGRALVHAEAPHPGLLLQWGSKGTQGQHRVGRELLRGGEWGENQEKVGGLCEVFSNFGSNCVEMGVVCEMGLAVADWRRGMSLRPCWLNHCWSICMPSLCLLADRFFQTRMGSGVCSV